MVTKSLFYLFYFCCIQWTLTTADSNPWPWDQTTYLTRSNWTSTLQSHEHSSAWIIFYYLNYCGLCKRKESGWEATSQYAEKWSKYLRMGAYDCASESVTTNEICQDQVYPQWRIYCPLTNSTHPVFETQEETQLLTAEGILRSAIEKLNDIASECFGKSWPIHKMFQATNEETLANVIPKDVKRCRVVVSNDTVLYSAYVLNNSATIENEPIYEMFEMPKNFLRQGIYRINRDDSNKIEVENLDSDDVMKPLKLYRNIRTSSSSSSTTTKTNIVSNQQRSTSKRPTTSDIDSAIIWMLQKDLRHKLPSETTDVKEWIECLHRYYPGSVTMRDFLSDLIQWMSNRTEISCGDLQNYLNSTSKIELTSLEFEHCRGSDLTKRGYPCSLWILFHSLTVQQAFKAERNQLSSTVKPSDLLKSIRKFVGKFFLCRECAAHFLQMTQDVENDVTHFNETVLFLWRGHNKVNARLRSDSINTDPVWPKIPFPSPTQCPTCVRIINPNGDAAGYNETEVYRYFKEFYSFEKHT